MAIKIPNVVLKDLPTPKNLSLEGVKTRLDACEEGLARFAREPYVAPLIHAIDAVRAPEKVMIDSAREAMFTFMKQQQATRAAGDAAAASVPKTGFSTPKEREQAISGAKQSIAGAVWDSAVEDAAEARRAEAEKIAEAAVEALRDADRAITAAVSEYTGPLAFAVPVTMDRLAQITGLRDELRTMKPSAFGPLLDGFIASENEERETLFIQSVVPLLDEMAKLSLVQLGKRLEMRPASGGNGGALEKERDAIYAMRRRIQERQEERVPEALKLAQMALPQIVAAFSLVFGWHASQLSKQDYERRYLRGGRAEALDVHPTWLARGIANCSVDDPQSGRR